VSASIPLQQAHEHSTVGTVVNSRILLSVRMVGRGIGFRVAVARLSSSVASLISFNRVSSADLENGDVRFGNLGIAFGKLRILFGGFGAGAAHHV